MAMLTIRFRHCLITVREPVKVSHDSEFDQVVKSKIGTFFEIVTSHCSLSVCGRSTRVMFECLHYREEAQVEVEELEVEREL